MWKYEIDCIAKVWWLGMHVSHCTATINYARGALWKVWSEWTQTQQCIYVIDVNWCELMFIDMPMPCHSTCHIASCHVMPHLTSHHWLITVDWCDDVYCCAGSLIQQNSCKLILVPSGTGHPTQMTRQCAALPPTAMALSSALPMNLWIKAAHLCTRMVAVAYLWFSSSWNQWRQLTKHQKHLTIALSIVWTTAQLKSRRESVALTPAQWEGTRRERTSEENSPPSQQRAWCFQLAS